MANTSSPSPPPINPVTARLMTVLALALVIIAIVALVVVVLLRGGVSFSSPSIVGLIGFLSLLVTAIVNLVQNQNVMNLVVTMNRAFNGHLDEHREIARAQGFAQGVQAVANGGEATGASGDRPASPSQSPPPR